MKKTVIIDGQSVQFSFSKCKVHLGGEMAGNFDVRISLSRLVREQTILDHLRLKLIETGEILDMLGSEVVGEDLEVTLFYEELIESPVLPDAVEVIWLEENEQSLGVIPVVEADIDRAEIESTIPESTRSGCSAGAAVFLFLVIGTGTYFFL